MKRRKFLKDVLLWSAGLSVSIPRFYIPEVFSGKIPAPNLALAQGQDYQKLVAKVISLLGGCASNFF
jgi:hypothetical protein